MQRGLLQIYLKNQDGVRQRQSFLMKYVPFCMMVTDTSGCINELQFHALITCNYMN